MVGVMAAEATAIFHKFRIDELPVVDDAGRPVGVIGALVAVVIGTLYGAINHLNDINTSIITAEDPVEYNLGGITQTQTHERIGMTFSAALRSLLRQDPDVILVGEIRDLETATIAVQAALTGHLVLSTLHTNTAAGAVTRLRDMGVEPFLLASSLIGVLAQRLVRVLDDDIKVPYTARSPSWPRRPTRGSITAPGGAVAT